MSRPDARMAVLLYHNVDEVHAEECRGLTVTPDSFARQMRALDAMGFHTISPADWVDCVRNEAEIPRRAIIITFDDAYASLTQHAFPALVAQGFTATVFVPTALLGRTIACNPKRADVTLPIMSADQIVHWSKKGISFGAHSLRHVDLASIPIEQAVTEMESSRDELARICGYPVRTFAYPYGRADDAVRDRAARLFDTAFTVEEGLNDLATPLHSLRRSMVQHGDTVADICLRAAYGKSAFAYVRTAVSGILRPGGGKA